MADTPQLPDSPTDLTALGAAIGAAILKSLADGKLDKATVATGAKMVTVIKEIAYETVIDEAAKLGELMHKLETPMLPIIGAFVAPIVAGLFNAEASEGDFVRKMARGSGTAAATSIVQGLMRAIGSDAATPIEPSDAGAIRIAAAAVQASLESSFNALVPEVVSDFLPFDFGKIEALTELPEGIIRTLGVSRLVRRALSPLVDATCATPAKWLYAKKYRQALLGAGEVARQVARGRWTVDQAKEELARAGYSDDRIEALLNAAAKFHSASDLWRLVRADQLSESEAQQHLQDAGYESDVASVELLLEKLKAIESFDRDRAAAGVAAFADGRIDEATLGGMCSGTTITAQEKAQHVELAHAKRIAGVKRLTPSEAAAAVKAEILAFADYRAVLRRENRDEDAITILELLLRAEIDKEKSIAQHRAELAAEKAAEKAARDAAALAKRQAHEQELTLRARGSIGSLEQAAIRGLIPAARVAEVYGQTFDAETVGVLLALLDAKRQDYLAQIAARDAAAAKADARGANMGQLEDAVLTGVLTLDEFRLRLTQLGLVDADADLVTATLAAKIAQRDAAKQLHDQAAAAAKVRHVDLGTLELLVRRGHRSMGDFDATLQGLGFDDGARAALREKLQIEIDDDAAAAKVRAAAQAALATKGLSLEQFRRAVLLGVKTVDQFESFLVTQHFTSDAVAALVAELQADRAEADAARQRRAAADAARDARDAPLADVAKAARLGIVPVQTYTDRLRRDGYTDDAIALEQDLLVTEIADVQAARDKRAAADAAAAQRGLSLTQIERAVKAGQASIVEYVGAARASGLTDDDAQLLGRVLQTELDVAAATRDRKAHLGELDADRELARADVAKGVLDGLQSLDDYAEWLTGRGYAPEDVDLLVAELQVQLDAKAAKAAGTPGE